MTAIWRRMYFSMITFVLFLIYARPTQIRSAVDGFRVNYKIASSITLCSVRPCVCVCVHFYRRFPVSASRFGNFLAVNYLKFIPVFLSFRKRCKSHRPRKNRYQRPAFATRSSPVRSSCRVVGLSAFSRSPENRTMRKFLKTLQPSSDGKENLVGAGRTQNDAPWVSLYTRTGCDTVGVDRVVPSFSSCCPGPTTEPPSSRTRRSPKWK